MDLKTHKRLLTLDHKIVATCNTMSMLDTALLADLATEDDSSYLELKG